MTRRVRQDPNPGTYSATLTGGIFYFPNRKVPYYLEYLVVDTAGIYIYVETLGCTAPHLDFFDVPLSDGGTLFACISKNLR